jgi:RNA polymerase sigma factor (sigma-70 family)
MYGGNGPGRGPSSRGDVPNASGEASFERVMLPHLDAAYNLARWLMRDREAAEDVLQEAMVRALTYFASFKGVNPRAWLLQIVRNTAYASRALNRGVETVPITGDRDEPIAAELISGEDDPESALLRTRESQGVRKLVAALPIELRETLVLREFEEFSYKEIAEATQTPIGTVMSRLWRARQLLAQAASTEGLR